MPHHQWRPHRLPHPPFPRIRNRITNPTVIITIALVAATIVYRAAQRRRLPPLAQLLWDASVSAIPARLLFAIDRLINLPVFPSLMLKTPSTTHAAKSEALRRTLGIDGGGGILGSVAQAGRYGFGSLSRNASGNSAARDKPPGLGNYDNSCYQNSILQGLASLKAFPSYLSAISLGNKLSSSQTRTVDTLRNLVAELSSLSSNGRTLWTPDVLKNMSTWQQQDAQEYYSKLLDQIDDEIAKASRVLQDSRGLESQSTSYDSSASEHSDDSGYHSSTTVSKSGLELRFARNPLEGLIAQRVACVDCGYCEGLTMIPFNCLTLTLGTLQQHDLYERLDHYTKVESIEGVECPKCSLIKCRDLLKALIARMGELLDLQQRLQLLEKALEEETYDEETLAKCNIKPKARASSTKTKQVALARPPQSLVFHVNRSGFDERTGSMFKKSAAVRFPMILDLAPWCLGSAESRAILEEGTVAAQDVEQWTLDPRSSMVAGNRGPSRVTGPIYELRAVVTHYGHHENGHYVCYRKHPVSPPPTKLEDEQAEKVFDHAGAAEKAPEDSESVPETELASQTTGMGEPIKPMPGKEAQQSQWWRLSDEDVTLVDERTVLSQGGVFMLFYDCVDPTSVPLPSGPIPPQGTPGPDVFPPGMDGSTVEQQALSPSSDEPTDTAIPAILSPKPVWQQETAPSQLKSTTSQFPPRVIKV
ncbi:cysteine proteinase [Parathielavia appendiculata]|uniref:ubiquitinyl hydrolase 1 n=1 Tax=Parathielavia appendiculata TaxID=2587402 RepID=A0AAN6U7C7_9PEZI|nr:cysteine proteinase [Parathielavia appendiculata]